MKDNWKNTIKGILFFLLIATLFSVSYIQLPLYSSNQNTYFVHGLAMGGHGYLSNDWLVKTINPFPSFTGLVLIIYKYLHEYIFYLLHIIFMGIFIFSILGIISRTLCLKYKLFRFDRTTIFLISLLIFIHSWFLQYFTLHFFGFDSRVWFTYGFAYQYILGSLFQPSIFGVFLVLSIYLWLSEKPYLAVISACIATNFHFSYLLTTSSLILSYILINLFQNRRYKQTAKLILLSLIFIIPSLLYSYLMFSPTSSSIFRRATDILINYRMPHHSNPSIWFNIVIIFKILLVIMSLYVVRGKRIFWIILVPFLVGSLLTIAQILTSSNYLAILFPWRISALLIPLAGSILIGKLVEIFVIKYRKRIPLFIPYIIILLSLSGSIFYYYHEYIIVDNPANEMMNFIRENREENSLYLLPIEDDMNSIKLDKFRLHTGIPIVVDFKSHPYKDIEILSWYERINDAKSFYSDPSCERLEELKGKYSVTHIVFEKPLKADICPKLREIYSNRNYLIYIVE